MPTNGTITPKARRCFENLAVAGPSTAAELDALDPTAPPHKQTLKSAQQAGYVVLESHLDHNEQARYTLTAKARALLSGKGGGPANASQVGTQTAAQSARPTASRFATRHAAPANITPPISYGSMTTARMVNACADMLAPAVRAGAEQALRVPSRVNDVLHYRDGRVVGMEHATTGAAV